jgi:hypothetical protein
MTNRDSIWPVATSRGVRLVAAYLAAVSALAGATAFTLQSSPRRSTPAGLYDANPNHLWNRIHEAFHVRTGSSGQRYGFDTVDPLLWRETRYLLTGSSHARALALMDEFLKADGERLISDPLHRAVFQHDLWSIFDWLAVTSEGNAKARQALMSRAARMIRRVALTKKQIEALPDTYAAAIRSSDSPPADLVGASAPWVGIGGTQPIVPQHAYELGRSAFIVFWSVPGGSAATFDYLRKLWDHPQPFVPDESFQFSRDGERRVKINPALPAVPLGTRIALVRKMLLIDDHGTIAPTNIVESIQLRTFGRPQTFAQWEMSRAELFAGRTGGLKRTADDERGFTTFSAKGMDPFEGTSKQFGMNAPVLQGCAVCHQSEFLPPIESIRSLRALLRPYTFVDPRHERWSRWFTQPIIAAEAKSRTFEWGLLQGLWQSQPR